MKNDKLAIRWVPPLSLGNPVVAYQQHDKDTCFFGSLAPFMVYYGDKTAAHAVHAASQGKHPVGKSKLQVVNDILVKHPHVYSIHIMQVDLSGDSICFYLMKANRK
eukprot:12802634-Ditylum_brightwellii.AAC.1